MAGIKESIVRDQRQERYTDDSPGHGVVSVFFQMDYFIKKVGILYLASSRSFSATHDNSIVTVFTRRTTSGGEHVFGNIQESRLIKNVCLGTDQ